MAHDTQLLHDEPFTYDVFISYSEHDRAWVRATLLPELEAAGLRVFADWAFELGAPRPHEMERGVQSARKTLLILTPAYLASATASSRRSCSR